MFESVFYKKEILPLLREVVCEIIDLYGKDQKVSVKELSDIRLKRIVLAFWEEEEFSMEFLTEYNAGFVTNIRICLRDPLVGHKIILSEMLIKNLCDWYEEKIQDSINHVHGEIVEQMDYDWHVENGFHQITDMQTGEKLWTR